MSDVDQEKCLLEFHRRYYDSRVWMQTYWRGVPTQKCPLDLWIYQEILFEVRPDLVIETGTADGGSAFFLASICDLIHQGLVITVDIDERSRPRHDRIEYLDGRSSTDPGVLAHVQSRIRRHDEVMVILDSNHSREHVLAELRAYAPLVTPGQYLIVEDTNINGHPVLPEYGPGPMEAVEEFLNETDAYEVDRTREKFGLTFQPCGYLRRRQTTRM